MRVPLDWLSEYVDLKGLKPVHLRNKLTMAGLEITAIEGSGESIIFEIEVTTNRPDWLSIEGVARETAAITGKKLKLVHRQPSTVNRQRSTHGLNISIKIEDKKGCPLYTGRVIRGVKVGPSPEWLVGRLEAMGLKSVNNVVDITNYCLFESGQPLHAFDLDKLRGGIVVRRARKAEEITTIDGVKRTLDKDILVIADESRPIAIAGVMGGIDTEVDSGTRNILLESAYFDPVTVRNASRKLKLVSESSYRFERGIELEGVRRTSDRAASLIAKVCGADGVGRLSSRGAARRAKSISISIRPSRANKVLGVEISRGRIEAILSSLGFSIAKKTRDCLNAEAPSFRRDIKREADIIEEVARIYGYENIPTTIPNTQIKYKTPPLVKEKGERIYSLARDIMHSQGIDEAITYALTKEGAVKVENPLSLEQAFLRDSLIPNILGVVSRNISRRMSDIKIYELGKIYHLRNGRPHEEMSLAVGLSGLSQGDWQASKRPFTYFDIKGIAELLLGKIVRGGLEVSEVPCGPPFGINSAELFIKGEKMGVMGEIAEGIADEFDIKQNTFVLELYIEKLLKYAHIEKRYRPVSKFQSVKRDIALIVKDSVSSEDIVKSIRSVGGDILKDVRLFDVYEGRQIPKGRRSLAYSVEYLNEKRTLTDTDVNGVHEKILSALEAAFGAEVRGNVK